MEAIREYLNNMFMSLPETPAVLRAKAELMEMMEDKYEELISEGKSEKEAVGTVISEFGNLEELADELGIQMYIRKNEKENPADEQPETSGGGQTASGNIGNVSNAVKKQYRWSFDDARDYLKYAWRHAVYVAVGVMLCIFSPYVSAVMDGAVEAGYVPRWTAEAIGVSCLFLLVAVAVGLFCMASHEKKSYGNVAKYGITLDEKAERLVEEKRTGSEQKRLWMRVAGIVLCIISAVPSSMNYFHNAFLREIMDSSVLILAGVGVCLIVLSVSAGNRYDELLRAVKNGNREGKDEWVQNVRQKNGKAGVAVAIICIVIFAGIAFVGCFGAVMYHVSGGDEENQSQITNEFEPEGLRELAVELDACEVCIEYGDVEKVQYEFTGDDRWVPEVTDKNGMLRIQEKRTHNWFGFSFNLFSLFSFGGDTRSVTVVIPKSLCPEQAENGLKYDIDVDAGNVVLKDLSGRQLLVDVDAGNVDGTGCEFAGNSEVDVDAGNVSFEQSCFHSLEADVDAGNFSVLASSSPMTFYALDLDVDLGDIVVDGQKMGDSYHAKPASQDQNGRTYKMNVEVDLGNIEVS